MRRRVVSGLAALAALLVLAVPAGSADERKPRRLESVTWSPVDHKLVWVVSNGELDAAGKYKAQGEHSYRIEMDAAIMMFNGERRRFSADEATSVRKLMDLVAKYAAESTVWWDQGQGQRVDRDGGSGKPAPAQPERPRDAPPRKPRPRGVLVPTSAMR